MAHWPLNWNVVRHDRVVGGGPRTPSDLDALRVEPRVSAVLSVQHDECLAEHKIDYPRQVRYGRRLSLTMERGPLRDFDPADQRRSLLAAGRGLYRLLRQGHRVYVHGTRRDQSVAAGGAGVSHPGRRDRPGGGHDPLLRARPELTR